MFTFAGVVIFIVYFPTVQLRDIKILFWIDPVQQDIYKDIENALKDIEALNLDSKVYDAVLEIDSTYDEDSSNGDMNKFCEILSTEGISVVLDFTYYPWSRGIEFVAAHNIPYLRFEHMLKPLMQVFAEFFKQKTNANDVVVILQNQRDEIEALFQVIEGFPFRTLLLNGGNDANHDADFVERMKNLKPPPSYYAIFATGSNMNMIFEKINKGKAFVRPAEWHFAFLDAKDRVFKYKKAVVGATKLSMNARTICKSLAMKDSYCLSGFNLQRALLFDILRNLISIRHSYKKWLHPWQRECINTEKIERDEFNIYDHLAPTDFISLGTHYGFVDSMEDHGQFPLLSFKVNISISFYSSEHEAKTDLAVWQNGALRKLNETISPAKRFFRIGITEAIPWSFYRRDARTYEISLDDGGKPIWEGFCVDMVKALAEKMNFDYELLPPAKGKFGTRDPLTGQWDGIVGDLVNSETDFSVAALKMYSEREEVIDFVAPYFEETGISIVTRKPVRQSSLFKFMTVLKLEVWMSIIAALVATSIMIWLLDKYSPYSYRNNRDAYSYPCREFTLRESFWFALTSFTPQGGGEAPKAVSSRILVAAYWVFVVLMLATFTANLAAFLTVERMQTTVQSLEQLARQSRINYTVVHGSDTHQYFINMKFAEDTLYRLWKELALNASEDYHKFRVWDYPIKEQYGHILLAINSSMPVKDAEEGFRKVNEHENADFAFIHDAAEIKYEITRNCNLTEVGEVFAEQPYAVAVQQGSSLINELSYALLELQKDRFLEELKAKYWNYSRLNCLSAEAQEGITLESLGGVFIATLFGLSVAVITLVLEVLYHRNGNRRIGDSQNIVTVGPAEALPKNSESTCHRGSEPKNYDTPPPPFEVANYRGRKIPSTITLGDEFKPKRLAPHLRRVNPAESATYKYNDLPAYFE